MRNSFYNKSGNCVRIAKKIVRVITAGFFELMQKVSAFK